MSKITVILYGPPGSGKGTQANLIAAKLNLIHFDTGRFLEDIVHDPQRQKEKMVRRERKLFDSGILMTPHFVLREVAKAAKKIANAKWGIIFSGSPRTIYEAKGLFPALEKLYGKKNIFIFKLNIPSKISLRRNGYRLLCSFCRAPLLTAYYPSTHPKYCPVCGGPLYQRTLDKSEVIKVRLKEYAERTAPIFHLAKKMGYRIHEVDGTAAPYRVSQQIQKYFPRKA